MRQCGDCTLCCKLLPVPSLGKLAGQRCKYQRHGKGCAVYHTRAMPPECAVWNCRWLVNDDTADLSRPDRSHIVLDIMPDFITLRDNETGLTMQIQIVQAWIDPRYPDAHRDPDFRAYVERRGQEGTATLVRFNTKEAMTLFPPSMSADHQWHEVTNGIAEKQHSFADVERALGQAEIITDERKPNG
jgi:hypothetical protein